MYTLGSFYKLNKETCLCSVKVAEMCVSLTSKWSKLSQKVVLPHAQRSFRSLRSIQKGSNLSIQDFDHLDLLEDLGIVFWKCGFTLKVDDYLSHETKKTIGLDNKLSLGSLFALRTIFILRGTLEESKKVAKPLQDSQSDRGKWSQDFSQFTQVLVDAYGKLDKV